MTKNQSRYMRYHGLLSRAQEKMNGVANNNSVIATTSMSRSRG